MRQSINDFGCVLSLVNLNCKVSNDIHLTNIYQQGLPKNIRISHKTYLHII